MRKPKKEIPYLPSMRWVEAFAESVRRRPPRGAVIDRDFLVVRLGLRNPKYGGQLPAFLESLGLVSESKLAELGSGLRVPAWVSGVLWGLAEGRPGDLWADPG